MPMLLDVSTRTATTASRPLASTTCVTGRIRKRTIARRVTKRSSESAVRRAVEAANRRYACHASAAAAQTTGRSTHQGRGLANVTLLLRPGQRLVITGDEPVVGLGAAIAAPGAEAVLGELAGEALRDGRFVALEGEVDVLAQRFPVRRVLLVGLVAGRRLAEHLFLRRRAAAVVVAGAAA